METPRPEVVVVLAGSFGTDDPERISEGVRVFHEKGCHYLILPLRHPSLKWPWLEKTYNINSQVSEERIIIGRANRKELNVNSEAGGTFTEAVVSIRLMEEKKLKSAIVVTSGYHLRRARLAFERALNGRDLMFRFHGVQRPSDSGIWWLERGYFFRVLREYQKLIGAYFMYRKKSF